VAIPFTIKLTVLAGELPAAFAQVSEKVSAPADAGVTV
jgi:hypothetical protein